MLLNGVHAVMGTFSNHTLAYFRFVDEISIIWIGSKESFLTFFKEINTLHGSIKFDCKYSLKNISFLNTTVFKNNQRSLSTKLFAKLTDRPGYIHNKSYHPKSQLKNITYGQALGVKHIRTEKDDLKEALNQLETNFQARGYKGYQINEQFARINTINRKELLTYKEKREDNKLKLMTRYNRNLPNIRSVIDNNWNALLTNIKLANTFKEKPILTYYILYIIYYILYIIYYK